MTNFFDNQNLLEIIWKWKKHLIIVGVLAVLFSAIFSSSVFIQPKYKSTARIYPSFNIYTFSDESESEQLLEIINSMDIKLRVIDAFNLSDVYKITKSDPLYQSYILGEFNDNVSFKKTEYETVEISVLDTDPKRASAMCDSIIAFLDDKIRTIHKVKYDEVVKIASKDLKSLDHELDSIKTKMDALRKDYKILDYESQAKEVTRGMVNVLAEQKKNTSGGKELQEWMKNLSEKGGEYEILTSLQKTCLEERDSIKKAYDQAVSSAKKKISYGQRIQNPIPSDKKAYPVRWLIVLASTLSALFIALLAILVLENRKKS
ncbi:MAG TPA: Wzz/FepE/Etk N-terminal domain-containing protein [Prolixibacteraceae bacterium]|nr:Wzz/FepE/Etk N-terminal domain-containing protein [Prolixibacteraceae bacterium]HPR84887.1 Wzz/FepE/Etk N-terminal domain-containing protein [Prolixibacteraceae bacterium]